MVVRLFEGNSETNIRKFHLSHLPFTISGQAEKNMQKVLNSFIRDCRFYWIKWFKKAVLPSFPTYISGCHLLVRYDLVWFVLVVGCFGLFVLFLSLCVLFSFFLPCKEKRKKRIWEEKYLNGWYRSFLSLVSQKKETAGRLMESKQNCHKKGCDEKNNKDQEIFYFCLFDCIK